MTRRQSLPALLTFGGLACGLGAIEATSVGAWYVALGLILFAAIADGVDGAVARRLRATSVMGMQLDSLSDAVTFGVAPALLFAARYAELPLVVRFGVLVVFAGAGLYRLARYNSEPTDRDSFCGLPITAGGVLLAALVVGPMAGNATLASVLAFGLAALMVSRVPYPTFAQWRWMLIPGSVVALIPIVLRPQGEVLAFMVTILLGMYALGGLTVGVLDEWEKHTAMDGSEDVRLRP